MAVTTPAPALAGLRGSLLSHAFARDALPLDFAGRLGETTRVAGRSAIRRISRRAEAAIGPASGARAIVDSAAAPLLAVLGFDIHDIRRHDRGFCAARLESAGQVLAALLAAPWNHSLDSMRRDATRLAAELGVPWAILTDGRALRLIDPARSYARGFLEFDLLESASDELAHDVMWAVCRAEALRPEPAGGDSLLHQILAASERHAVRVCRSLRDGVLEALDALVNNALDRFGARRRAPVTDRLVGTLHEQCLTIVYRVLFLLFAEARALVPLWHPLFRDGYSIESLRVLAEDPAGQAGLWDALQATCRLAHHGCHAGDLVVTPFNGRLFAPDRTAAADRIGVADDVVRRAIVALSSEPGGASGRRRIAYGDLGVEQLGGVYESLLDFTPAISNGPSAGDKRPRPRLSLRRGSGRRKATGSFYTPRAITEYLVRRALHPLVAGRSADDILRLRILDPAMGSGAFLVACCRYLASAYEAALVAEGRAAAGEIDPAERASFRRLVAQRCLYGVDLNPMAVQLACLSLWLATLAADRPLTFLDHHLLLGDSLVGASFDDLSRQPPGARRHQRAPARLPLFEDASVGAAIRQVVPARLRLALEPDDSAEAVRRKELTLAGIGATDAGLSRWKDLADLWCAGWFWTADSPAPPPRAFGELADAVLRDRSTLPATTLRSWRASARRIGIERRFFHWSFEFPEAFFDAGGQPLADAGFDAVLGNPPWEMLRNDARPPHVPMDQLGAFVRTAGIYRTHPGGHVNLYHLFVERALALLRPGGRLGLVAPSGLATDHGARELRRTLLDRCETDSIVSFDNRAGIFPIHRGLRFLLITSTKGALTASVRCRFGETDPAVLDRVPDGERQSRGCFPIVFTRSLIEAFSSDERVIPDVRTRLDLEIVEMVTSSHPRLGDADGWRARFSRELNATDDREHLSAGDGLPVLEGKHLGPFTADIETATRRVDRRVAARLVDPARTFRRERLAYRDVASATNQLTLIATLLPRNVLTTHTVFCLTTRLAADEQRFLCGMLNSYVANYLVRLRVTTHVTTAVMKQLRVPKPDQESPGFVRVVEMTDRLLDSGGADATAHAGLQAAAARLYGLTREQLAHVLGTFPLVKESRKADTLGIFDAACHPASVV